MSKPPPLHAIKYDANSLTVYGRVQLLEAIMEELESQCSAAYPPAGGGSVGLPAELPWRPLRANYPHTQQRGLRISLGLCALKGVFDFLNHHASEPVAAMLRVLARGWAGNRDYEQQRLAAALCEYACNVGARPEQITFAHSAMQAPLGRGVLSLPTGFGKTWVAWLILKTMAERLAAWDVRPQLLVLVGSPTIAEQLTESFNDLSARNDSALRIPHLERRNLTVTTYGRAEPEALRKANVLIVDECHQVPARTRRAAVEQCTGTLLRVGLSATPFMRTDGANMWVAALLGPCVGSAELGDVIADGGLAVPLVQTK